MVNYAKQLHKVELNCIGALLRVRENPDGTANLVSVDMARLQKDEGFSDEQAATSAGYSSSTTYA